MSSSALLESIAIKYAKSKGLDYISKEATEYAKKLLGIDKQEGNPKYAFGMPFTDRKFNPLKMIVNQGIKGITSGAGGSSFFAGAAPFLAGGLGLAYLTNPLRQGSYNYNPELRGQIDYASGRGFINRNNSAGLLRYGPESVLSGQNVISGFGTNDYSKQLQKYINKFNKYDNITPGQKAKKKKAQRELEDFTTSEFDEVDAFMKENNNNQSDGGSGNNYGAATQSGGFDPGGFEQDGTGRQGYGRGGIASL